MARTSSKEKSSVQKASRSGKISVYRKEGSGQWTAKTVGGQLVESFSTKDAAIKEARRFLSSHDEVIVKPRVKHRATGRRKSSVSSPYIKKHSDLKLKGHTFKVVKDFLQPDAKMRISLGGVMKRLADRGYRVFQNDIGQIVFDPVKVVSDIPEREQWLHDTPEASASLRRGLKQSAAGETVDLGSFARHAK